PRCERSIAGVENAGGGARRESTAALDSRCTGRAAATKRAAIIDGHNADGRGHDQRACVHRRATGITVKSGKSESPKAVHYEASVNAADRAGDVPTHDI